LEVDGVFVEMGYTAKTDWVKGFVQLNENGEIVTDKLGMTSRPGVFAAGDVTDILYKQAVIAAAQGAIAALSAYNYVQRLRGLPTKKSDWD
jgi:thioredoxin reductase (NADPH)